MPDKSLTKYKLTHYRPSRTLDRNREKITHWGVQLRRFLRRAKGSARFIPFLGSDTMPSPSAREIPNIDFRLIPVELQGSWVVVRVGEGQQILGSGATARQALASCASTPDDVLTQVPELQVLTYVSLPDTR